MYCCHPAAPAKIHDTFFTYGSLSNVTFGSNNTFDTTFYNSTIETPSVCQCKLCVCVRVRVNSILFLISTNSIAQSMCMCVHVCVLCDQFHSFRFKFPMIYDFCHIAVRHSAHTYVITSMHNKRKIVSIRIEQPAKKRRERREKPKHTNSYLF